MIPEKLIKVLKLTESDNDNEALVALRTAKQIMREEKIEWQSLLGPHKSDSKGVPTEEYNALARKHNALAEEYNRLLGLAHLVELERNLYKRAANRKGLFSAIFG